MDAAINDFHVYRADADNAIDVACMPSTGCDVMNNGNLRLHLSDQLGEFRIITCRRDQKYGGHHWHQNFLVRVLRLTMHILSWKLCNGLLIFCTTASAPSTRCQFTSNLLPSIQSTSTNNQRIIFRKLILGDLQVQWRRTLSYTSRNIVVRAVAGAEPSAEIACFTNRYAS